MKCGICGAEGEMIYEGSLKTGLLSGYTKKSYPVYQCTQCKTIWNMAYQDEKPDYYEQGTYREKIEENTDFHTLKFKYDKQVLFKMNLTGTEGMRGKTVCDIGCGEGCFLDFISGPAENIVAVEPNVIYQKELRQEGYHVYAYAEEALKDWRQKIDLITSFDVIEHTEDPRKFVREIYELLPSGGGQCVIGTPTDYPVLRKLLGDTFNQFIFQVQHPWIFSERVLRILFEEVGFCKVTIKNTQKYGLGNFIAWLHEQIPRGDLKYDFISETMDQVYRQQMAEMGNGEYLTVYALK